jgi:hypothetical protein
MVLSATQGPQHGIQHTHMLGQSSPCFACVVVALTMAVPAAPQISLLGIQFQWTADTQLALASAKTDKGIMAKNNKKTEAILRWACAWHQRLTNTALMTHLVVPPAAHNDRQP